MQHQYGSKEGTHYEALASQWVMLGSSTATDKMNPKLSLSVVSHGHKNYVRSLLRDLAQFRRTDIEVILTLNIPEDIRMDFDALPFQVVVIRNSFPKGLAANHNAAFDNIRGDYFVILNPDIKLIQDPFDEMLSLLEKAPGSICAPTIVNRQGMQEDHARRFPTPSTLVRRTFYRLFKLTMETEQPPRNGHVLTPDWIAGMFVVVPRTTYTKLKGLDERYFLYFEDVDFCARAQLAGHKILVTEHARAIHDAQRDSHRKPRYFLWHLHSAVKFFTSSVYRNIRLRTSESMNHRRDNGC